MTQSNISRVIGITGITGSGKSFVSTLLARRGAAVIDADAISRQLSDESCVLERIKAELSPDVTDEHGKLDRAKLARLVFNDESKLRTLNSIMHPFIAERITAEVTVQKELQRSVIVIDAPLLLEAGLNSLCDEVWLITASDEVRIRRLSFRGLTRKEALLRINARDEAPMRAAATIIIENNDAKNKLRAALDEAIKSRGLFV